MNDFESAEQTHVYACVMDPATVGHRASAAALVHALRTIANRIDDQMQEGRFALPDTLSIQVEPDASATTGGRDLIQLRASWRTDRPAPAPETTRGEEW